MITIARIHSFANRKKENVNKPKKYLEVESVYGVKTNLPIHRIQFTTPEGLIGFKRESGFRKGLAAVQVSKETLEEVEKMMLGL